ncbi:MAG: hypothetical protein SFV23_11405 [Planctomycetaceae bacterium]|nr:hypothetical protein [Planctomycetaceae bacterium]
MKSWMQVLLSAAVAVMVASEVNAQPGGRGPGGPGGRGPGGFGGGGDAFLLQMPEVQKELGVTEEQQGLLKDMMADLMQSGPRPDFSRFRDMSEEERQKAFEEMRKQGEAIAKKAEDAIKVVLDEKQFARYSELKLQRQGTMALLRPEVAKALDLNPDQQEKLIEIRDANRPPGFGGLGGRGPGGPGGEGGRPPRGEGAAPGGEGARPDFQAMMAEMQKRREKAEADAIAVLTPEQKTKWEQMLGKKFDFQAPNFGGPGGPGGGRRPGGQRPPAE